MDRKQTAFLHGFQRAAQLTQSIVKNPPRHTSPADYLRDVAALHGGSDDPQSRGLAAGCLAAFGCCRR